MTRARRRDRLIIPGGEGPRGLWNGSNVKGVEGQDRELVEVERGHIFLHCKTSLKSLVFLLEAQSQSLVSNEA